MKITYCVVHLNRLKNLQKAVRHHAPHVDRTIVVDGGSTDGTLEWLASDECKQLRVEVVNRPWTDDPPGSRNAYLQAAGHEGWCLAMDDDEYLEEPAIWSIKQIAEQAEKSGASSVAFNAHDIQVNEKGEVWENKSNYWNSIIFFKLGPRVRFHGHTHVSLSYMPGHAIQSPFRYFHIKTTMEQWIRGARNYWTTANPASNSIDERWKQFKKICSNHGLQYFYQMAALMESGMVPEDLERWIIDNRDSDNAEIRSYFVTYFIFQHPEKNMGYSNRDFSFVSDRQPFRGLKF